MWTLVSLPPMCICTYNGLWEILCISLMFSASLFPPQLFLPLRSTPSACLVIAEAFWGAQWDSTMLALFAAFRHSLHRKVCLSLLQNTWERTNSIQPVKAESKLESTSVPAIFYFDWISLMHIWNLSSHCNPDVLLGLVSMLCKRTNAPLRSL